MRSHFRRLGTIVLLTVALIITSRANVAAAAPTSWKVFATGLESPRGLQFGPDGSLYIAEGGEGGTHTTTSQDCQQVPDPSGPYRGGMTARISKIDADGKRTTVIDGLPSTATSPRSGSDISGVAAVAFVNDSLYAVISGAGCSHGNKGTVNSVVSIDADGKATQVADLSGFFFANPVKIIDGEDFEPDGDIYSMIQVDGKFYILEANHGELDEVTTDGTMTRIVDISATQGHSVPTALAYKDGNFYVGTLSIFPVTVGTARIYKITPDGELTVLTPHLTAVVALAFDQQGQLYALETSTTDHAYPTPGSGTVVRLQPDSDKLEVIVTDLSFPTAMTFGPDGMLYISNFGYGSRPGTGQIVRLTVPPSVGQP